MSHPETIRIKHLDGYAVINKSDFNPKQHQLFEADAPAPIAPAPQPEVNPPAPAASAPPTPDEIKAKLQSLNVEDFTYALLEAPDFAAVALAEQAENEREGGPRKGALRAIAERRAELEAQAPN